MRYAMVDDGVVTNIIWLHPANKDDFPNAVSVDDYPVAEGDVYVDGKFYRDGEPLRTQTEILLEEMQDAKDALSLLGVNGDA